MIRKNRTPAFKVESSRCDNCFMELRCWPESTPRTTPVPVEREPTMQPGTSLWRHGAPFDSLYIVRSGAIKVHETDLTGEERAGHDDGWTHYLGRLTPAAVGEDPGPDSWITAA